MKVIYDPETDALTVELRSAPVADSDELRPGLILDYDADGDLVGLEVLDASATVFTREEGPRLGVKGLETSPL
jgi:uncharacterized protein YuzE